MCRIQCGGEGESWGGRFVLMVQTEALTLEVYKRSGSRNSNVAALPCNTERANMECNTVLLLKSRLLILHLASLYIRM